jgi:hypothetical protein
LEYRVEESKFLVRKPTLTWKKPCLRSTTGAADSYQQLVQARYRIKADAMTPTWFTGYQIFNDNLTRFSTESLLFRADFSLLSIISPTRNTRIQFDSDPNSSRNFESGETSAILAIRTNSTGTFNKHLVLARSDGTLSAKIDSNLSNRIRYTSDGGIVMRGLFSGTLYISGFDPIKSKSNDQHFILKTREAISL